ncbi:MAG TPA: A/G-specific adenine glycosylase [Candidatus Eisenbergiella merdipullorum]|uniref:Sugar fermentation stimulation protein homolog n=1 Tax=Candidatus Eisenbergiella merdipullorum TaxID=2838553 RepID=A0A9D2I3W2_9FIRM|nr:A/G-specific adenine glycosylase [Candidatus Eisenbergiella merdipullorum]
MKYNDIREGIFLERPNRFIAYVRMDGKREKVHVKNTGRCRELLQEGALVYLEHSGNPARSTAYDLVTVKKGDRLVNMDSAAPNKAAEEWLKSGGLCQDVAEVRPECTLGRSRFDFRVRTRPGGARKGNAPGESGREEEIWVEVKGVNLERDNVALFPDAPSLRAVKHVEGLMEAKKEGYGAVLLFVVQMEGISRFMPNVQTQPEFAEVLLRARDVGVRIMAMGCRVQKDGMRISYEIPVFLPGDGPADRKDKGNASLIAPRLLPWYDGHRRQLPWRRNPTPYRVWISEIMLQQTRVEAVKPYFERFMEELPDIASLAAVPEERLLKLWEGLGYYSRARNLKKAACQIMERFAGKMPAEVQELLSLPGIGPYTAGAISSIACGRPVPAVDGNVLRVMARFRMDDRDMTNQTVRKSVESLLAAVIPADRPGDFNQAMMEIGALVCLPNGAPRCGECPLAEACMAHELGRELDFPRKTPKKKRAIDEKTVLVILDEKKAAFRKRPDGGLLAGMYELPALEGKRKQAEVIAFLKEKGLNPIRIKKLPAAKHIFTHREWHMTGYAVWVDELEPYKGGWDGLIFADRSDLDAIPVPSAFSAYLDYVKSNL